MLHIVFSKEDEEALRKSFELDDDLAGDVLVFDQNWSVGPLMGSINSEGDTTSRDEWLVREFRIVPAETDPLEKLKKYLRDNEDGDAWIWIAPNARDVCGYYHLVSSLDAFQGRLYSLWLNNLPFINDKGQIFYPVHLSEILPREFVKAKRLAQQISPAIFETDPDEWKRMKQENKLLRIVEGAKKIAGKIETFFDKELLAQLQGDWQKSSKIISQVIAKSKGNAGKEFLAWRLREMVQKNELEAKSDWTFSDNFDVKKMAASSAPVHE